MILRHIEFDLHLFFLQIVIVDWIISSVDDMLKGNFYLMLKLDTFSLVFVKNKEIY